MPRVSSRGHDILPFRKAVFAPPYHYDTAFFFPVCPSLVLDFD